MTNKTDVQDIRQDNKELTNILLNMIVYLYSVYFYFTESGYIDDNYDSKDVFFENIENFSIYFSREHFEPFENIIRKFCEGKFGANECVSEIMKVKTND